MRSTTGSILRVKVSLSANLPKTLLEYRAKGVPIISTSAKAKSVAYDTDLSSRPLVLVVGNESLGITDATREAATEFVNLPMAANGASSLNVTVAAGVLVYEAIRQRRAIRG